MKNIFSQRKDYVEDVKRNTFDLSFQNNLTMKFGRLYPVFCKEVIPGDSFKIKPTFGLRFMPLVFPVQTRMQANLHFFYVRNRTLWKDWMDFIGRTKSDLVPPYIAPIYTRSLMKTGALGDYFGVPTTISGDYGSKKDLSGEDMLTYTDLAPEGFSPKQPLVYRTADNQNTPLREASLDAYAISFVDTGGFKAVVSAPINKPLRSANFKFGYRRPTFPFQPFNGSEFSMISYTDDQGMTDRCNLYLCFYAPDDTGKDKMMAFFRLARYDETTSKWWSILKPQYAPIADDYATYEVTLSTAFYDVYGTGQATGFGETLKRQAQQAGYDVYSEDNFFLLPLTEYLASIGKSYRVGFVFGEVESDQVINQYEHSVGNNKRLRCPIPLTLRTGQFYGFSDLKFDVDAPSTEDIDDLDIGLNPYYSGDIKISALPFRAYEAIYNAFYRNQQNDPFKLNGVPEYNKFVTNDAGGADSTPYDFFNRNWELDFLTSATQTPQQGDLTPLVGVSASGDFTFLNEGGTTTVVHPTFGADGATLTGIAAYEGVTPADGSLPAGVRRLAQLIPYGISINDFRNVNAFQRWLETNLRRGYRYRDQIKSHFNVDVEYKELDMPEFIGGVSEPVIVNQINQTTGTSDGIGDFKDVLGSYAGQASILAQSQHDIDHYCDEHGFIIGIMSISPVPNYSQLLPKQLIKDNVLDFYFPEFGHIGNQPITYREVCPLQSFAAGDSLNDVFGYQRAWYEYIASTDEVHGEMRLSMRDYLINRVFDVRPELGRNFLEVNDTQINDIFATTDDKDKIIGQIYFDVIAQRPIPKLGIPRLE